MISEPHEADQPDPQHLSEEDRASLHTIFKLLHATFNIDFSQYRRTTVLRRLFRRMSLCHLSTMGDYAARLKKEPDELQQLKNDLLLYFTDFFRDPNVFKSLEDEVFDPLFKNRLPKEPVRVWVPGCSTGEEVYSLAICLAEYIRKHRLSATVQLFGTDLVADHITKARAAIYPEKNRATISKDRLNRYFDEVPNGIQVTKQIREMCIFATQDITRDPPFPNIDLVSCRNVLIYFNESFQDMAFPLFHFALKPNGFLLLGTSETVSRLSHLFRMVNPRTNIYQKIEQQRGEMPRLPFSNKSIKQKTGRPLEQRPADNKTVMERVDQLLLEAFVPPGVMVDQNLHIRRFFGQLFPFITPAAGEASLNLSKMIHESLLPDLYVAIEETKLSNQPVCKPNLTVNHEGMLKTVDLNILPLVDPNGETDYFLIHFAPPANPPIPSLSNPETDQQSNEGAQIDRLREELRVTKKHLQKIISEKDDVNMELWAANEEVQSTNEELQSVNEEMEAAKEELESSNEELLTLNEELQSKNLALQESQQRLNSYIDAAPDAIFVADQQGNYVLANPAAARMTGFTIDELLCKNLRGITPEFDQHLVEAHFTQVLNEGHASGEMHFIRKDGSCGTWMVDAVKLSEDRFLGFARETTKQRSLEAQLRHTEKMRAVGQLAGGIAHDFNNQLASIAGFADLLVDELEVGSAGRNYVDNIQIGVKNAADLTAQLLAFSRKGKYLNIPVNLADTLETVIALLYHAIDRKITIEQQVRSKELWVIGDPHQLQNGLLHLGLNARDAMPNGGTLTFTADLVEYDHPQDTGDGITLPTGPYVWIEVADTGVGISQEHMPHIFEPFFTTRETGEGVGMGLAAVYGTVTNHKGTIAVTSQPGRGTQFQIRLPYHDRSPHQAPDPRSGASSTDPAEAHTPARLLLVEDDEPVREVATHILQSAGYHVTTACDGQEALQIYQQYWQTFDLVILDMIMPVMGGRDTFNHMKQINPNILALLSSGYSLNQTPSTANEPGIFDFLQKPYRKATLTDKVAQALKSRR